MQGNRLGVGRILGIKYVLHEVDVALSRGNVHGSPVARQMANSQARQDEHDGGQSQPRENFHAPRNPHRILLPTPTFACLRLW